MKPPFMRTPYNYDRDEASLESGLKCNDPTLTQQQFKEEADINTLVDRFHLSGEMPQRLDLPAQSDYEGVFDFQTAMNAIRAAQEDFMRYPAWLRERFDNDPQKFLEFCDNEENIPEARKMGLVKPETRTKAEQDHDRSVAEKALAAAERASEDKVGPPAPPKPPKT